MKKIGKNYICHFFGQTLRFSTALHTIRPKKRFSFPGEIVGDFVGAEVCASSDSGYEGLDFAGTAPEINA